VAEVGAFFRLIQQIDDRGETSVADRHDGGVGGTPCDGKG